jgi:hypothetical protein
MSRVALLPATGGAGLAPVWSVGGVVVIQSAFGFDFHDQPLAVLTVDQEVGRVRTPFAECILTLVSGKMLFLDGLF